VTIRVPVAVLGHGGNCDSPKTVTIGVSGLSYQLHMLLKLQKCRDLAIYLHLTPTKVSLDMAAPVKNS